MENVLVLRTHQKEDTVIDVKGIKIGGKNICLMAGPCAVESDEQIKTISSEICDSIDVLRGGTYKMRTSPYTFQGLGIDGLKYLHECGIKENVPVISEITAISQLKDFEKYVDIIQVGARNMQNFDLLKALGKSSKPILLKRGFGNTIEEWLSSAEYILCNGNKNVILCERGIKTFENMTRFTLDISSIPLIKKLSHLPVIVDPSHAAGHADLVKSLSLAAIAAGADGLLIEVHNKPKEAISDSSQALNVNEYKDLVKGVKNVAKAIGRDINE